MNFCATNFIIIHDFLQQTQDFLKRIPNHFCVKMNSKTKKGNSRNNNPLQNPLVLNSIFKNLSTCDLCKCRLMSNLWNALGLQFLRKTLSTRLILCADPKCAKNLDKFINCFKNSGQIPYTRAMLILDHLPTPESLLTYNPEDPLGLEALDLDRTRWKKDALYFALSKIDSAFESSSLPFEPRSMSPPSASLNSLQHSYTLYTATVKFAPFIENLIVTLSLHQEPSHQNINYWLGHLNFPSLKELQFQITKTSPDDLCQESLEMFFNSAPNLNSLVVRKLCKNSDLILHKILNSLKFRKHPSRLKSLTLEVFTDDSSHHLEILTHLPSPLALTHATLLYLGGEVRFVDKLEALKGFLRSVSQTLQVLLTHIPLFTGSESNLKTFPVLPRLRVLKIEKVYREFATPEQSQIFDFPFSKYFPNLEQIEFRDYDLWKNTQLKAFPLECIQVCGKVGEISVPDLCFDGELVTRYFKMFPNVRKLSLILSYMSKHQEECILTKVYTLLPNLKNLNVEVYDIDLPLYDTIFIGFSSEDCEHLSADLTPNCENKNLERKSSLESLKHLEYLKITHYKEEKELGISNLTVVFGFLKMDSLKKLTIGPSMITSEGLEAMAQRFDLIQLESPKLSLMNDKSCKEDSKFKNRNASTSSGRHDCGHLYL